MGGQVTDIMHVAGKSPVTYEKGDQQFDVGTVLRSHRGWPFTVIDTDRNDFTRDFGIPDRNNANGYHAYYALYIHANTVGRYVRVVSNTAEYPFFSFQGNGASEDLTDWAAGTTYAQYVVVTQEDVKYVSQIAGNTGNDPATDDGTNWVPLLEAGKATFATAVAPGGDVSMVFWLKNGEVRENKFGLKISDKNAADQTFVITLYENKDNSVQVGESLTVSLDPSALGPDGRTSRFIESVLENNSDILAVKVATGAAFANIWEHDTVWFTGGNDTAAPSDQNYADAWNLLKDIQVNLDLVFMAGDSVDAHVLNAVAVAEERDIRLEGDFPAGTSVTNALTWLAGLSLKSHHVSFTYGSVSFNDPWYTGMRQTLGCSGFLAQCKAYGRETSKTISDPGIEEAPAGEDFGQFRGITGVRNETTLSASDKASLANAWCNYIINGSTTGVIAWEQYTLYGEDTSYAYKRDVDVINYIYHEHRKLMLNNQFRGKTDRQIINDVTKVLTRLKTKEVLLPDESDLDFPEAFRVWITRSGSKVEINRMIRIQKGIGPVVLRTIPY